MSSKRLQSENCLRTRPVRAWMGLGHARRQRPRSARGQSAARCALQACFLVLIYPGCTTASRVLLKSCNEGCHVPCPAYTMLLRCNRQTRRRTVLSDQAAGQQLRPSPASRTSPQQQLCPERPGTAACASSARGCGSSAMPKSLVMQRMGRRYRELALILQQLYQQLHSLHQSGREGQMASRLQSLRRAHAGQRRRARRNGWAGSSLVRPLDN